MITHTLCDKCEVREARDETFLCEECKMISVSSAHGSVRTKVRLEDGTTVVRTIKDLRNMACVTRKGRVLYSKAYCGRAKINGIERLCIRLGDPNRDTFAVIAQSMEHYWQDVVEEQS